MRSWNSSLLQLHGIIRNGAWNGLLGCFGIEGSRLEESVEIIKGDWLLLIVVLIDELVQWKRVRSNASFNDRAEFLRVDLSVLVQIEDLICFFEFFVRETDL